MDSFVNLRVFVADIFLAIAEYKKYMPDTNDHNSAILPEIRMMTSVISV